MKIGVPLERKPFENRVSLTPSSVQALVDQGHEVWVEAQAGLAAGYADADFRKVGGKIATSVEKVYHCDLLVKVKEPQLSEVRYLREGQMVFTFFHFAAYPRLLSALLKKKVIAVGYETIVDAKGNLPLLAPMSQLAGRLAIDVGTHYLQVESGGKGKLLGRFPGIAPTQVVVIGGGVVGRQAAFSALRQGAEVTLFEKDVQKLQDLDRFFSSQVRLLYPYRDAIEKWIPQADVLVGAVLSTGRQAPKVVQEGLVRLMEPGSVLIDVAIDQGGCIATSLPTTLQRPIRVVHHVLHYAVANMPSLVAQTATQALATATFPYLSTLAEKGWQTVVREDPLFACGFQLMFGSVTHRSIAEDLHMPYTAPETFCELRSPA